jgi:hypothetical protein
MHAFGEQQVRGRKWRRTCFGSNGELGEGAPDAAQIVAEQDCGAEDRGRA